MPIKYTSEALNMSGWDFVSQIAKDKVVTGMLLQVVRDIFITKSCKDKGQVEIKFASEGDDVTVIDDDPDNPAGGVRVINHDNHDEIETVSYDDLEDTFGS